jgi:ankyrin repeat protein
VLMLNSRFFETEMLNGSSFSYSGYQLLEACDKGNLAAVQKLLDDGVDVNWKDANGYTGLIWASAMGHVNVVKLLLDRGALIDPQCNLGHTALMIASITGKFECVQLLLERGADMSLKSKDIRTAKNFAVGRGHFDIVRLLNEVCMLQNQDKYFKFRQALSNVSVNHKA